MVKEKRKQMIPKITPLHLVGSVCRTPKILPNVDISPRPKGEKEKETP